MLFFETSRICDRVALLFESYSPYTTAENEGRKVPYEKLSVVASLSSYRKDKMRLHVSTVSNAGVAHHGVFAAHQGIHNTTLFERKRRVSSLLYDME